MKARRPLIGLVLLFITGTWCGLELSLPPLYPAAAAWCLILLAVLALIRSRRRAYPDLDGYEPKPGNLLAANIAVMFSVICIGWSAAAMRTQGSAVHSDPKLENDATVQVEGVVINDPVATQREAGNTKQWYLSLQLQRYRTGSSESWSKSSDRIAIAWNAPARRWSPSYGDCWQFTGRYKAASRSGQTGLLLADRYKADFVSRNNGNSFVGWCYDGRRNASRYLAAGIEEFIEQSALLQALVLGYRSKLPIESKRNFAASGTLHIFAISGLHVGMVAMLIIFVLNAFRVSRVNWILILAPLLVIYTVATGARASAVRACIMAVVFFAAPFFRRKSDSLSALALAALLILAFKPQQLHNIGFIYSFVVVAGLILLYPILLIAGKRLFRMCCPTSLLPDPFEPDADMVDEEQARLLNRKAWTVRTADYFMSMLSISCAAWLASAPLTAYLFGRFSPVSVLGNLLVIPLTFLIVLAGSLSLVFGSLWLEFADLFNHASVVLISVLTGFIELLTKIPFGSMEIKRIPLWSVLLWYASLACVDGYVGTRGDSSHVDGMSIDRQA